MGELILKELKGHSGSKVYLMQNDEHKFVRKIGNVSRNFERYTTLSEFPILNLPKVYKHASTNEIDIEYFPSLDMKTYLLFHSHVPLMNYIENVIETLSQFTNESYNFTKDYYTSLSWMETEHTPDIPFTRLQLIGRLPSKLPFGLYLGDFTLENILYGKDGKFHIIDPVTVPYASWVFDIAKLRQDLECKWFLRNEPSLFLDAKLGLIQQHLKNLYPQAFDDNLLILMLLRVYRHCEPNSVEYNFIVNEVNRLWK